MRALSQEEKDALCVALNCRSNIIETGTPSLAALDVQRRGLKEAVREGLCINALTVDQMKLVILTKELAIKIQQNMVYIQE